MCVPGSTDRVLSIFSSYVPTSFPPVSKLEFPNRVFVYYGTTRRSVHWERLTRCVSYPDPAMGGFVIDTPTQITGDHGFHTEWVSWYSLSCSL